MTKLNIIIFGSGAANLIGACFGYVLGRPTEATFAVLGIALTTLTIWAGTRIVRPL